MNPKDAKTGPWTVIGLALATMLGGCAARRTEPLPVPAAEPAVLSVGAERNTPKLANAGQALPLRKAIEQLAPPDYSVRWVGVDASRQTALVTWHADQQWTDALDEVVRNVPGVSVTIATGSRLVLVRAISNDLRSLPKPSPKVAPGGSATTRTPAASAKPASSTTTTGAASVADGPRIVQAVEKEAPAGSAQPATVLERVSIQGVRTAAVTSWRLEPGDQTLRAALDRWSRKAGWQMFWEMGVDYPIAAPADIDGSFEDAVAVVVRSLSQADVPPKAVFYRGNHVLRLIPRGKE